MAIGLRIIALKKRIVADFKFDNWLELGMLTGFSADVESHSRFLRSLSFGDDDYEVDDADLHGSTIIQDIFNLIFRANVVVVDFSGRNPNVMYETGIAHTLGKDVVLISRSVDDVPFDLRHHRVQTYLPNGEGIAKLQEGLQRKLAQFAPPLPSPAPPAKPVLNLNDDDIPF